MISCRKSSNEAMLSTKAIESKKIQPMYSTKSLAVIRISSKLILARERQPLTQSTWAVTSPSPRKRPHLKLPVTRSGKGKWDVGRGDVESADVGTRRRGDSGMWGRGDSEKRGRGDSGTWYARTSELGDAPEFEDVINK